MRGITFVGKRMLFAGFLLVVVSFLVFSLQSFSKGSFVATVLGNRPASPEQIQQIREQYHLDDGLLTRYWLWLQDAVHLDFGRSIKSDTSVFAAIEGRLPITLELTFLAIIIVVLIGVPLGMVSGIRQGTMIDRISTSTSIVGLSAPVFATGIFLLYVFGVYLGWFPVVRWW